MIKVTYACGGVTRYPDRETYELAKSKGILGCPACALDYGENYLPGITVVSVEEEVEPEEE